MPELEHIQTLGELFTVENDPEHVISSIECVAISFAVNKNVIIALNTIMIDRSSILGVVSYNGKRRLFSFRGMWEIGFADFLEVDNGIQTIKLDGIIVNVNAYGIVEPASVRAIENRVLSEFKPSRKMKLEECSSNVNETKKKKIESMQ
jgi:hypothetical protein